MKNDLMTCSCCKEKTMYLATRRDGNEQIYYWYCMNCFHCLISHVKEFPVTGMIYAPSDFNMDEYSVMHTWIFTYLATLRKVVKEYYFYDYELNVLELSG